MHHVSLISSRIETPTFNLPTVIHSENCYTKTGSVRNPSAHGNNELDDSFNTFNTVYGSSERTLPTLPPFFFSRIHPDAEDGLDLVSSQFREADDLKDTLFPIVISCRPKRERFDPVQFRSL